MKVMGKVLLASSLLMALGASAYAAGITWVKIPIAATSCTSVNTTSHASWTNNTGRALNVSRAYIWAGMDQGSIADFNFCLANGSATTCAAAAPNYILPPINWDHYAEPTGINDQIYSMSFNTAVTEMQIPIGGTVTVIQNCTSYNGNTASTVTGGFAYLN